MSTGGIVLVALVIAVGIAGIVVPLLPGIVLVYAAILVWAVIESSEHDVAAWVTLGVVTALIGATTLIKYLWPMKRLRAADVGAMTLLAGAALGVVGFFVIPIVGLVIGFVFGVYLAELANRRDQRAAWTSTKHALKGVALSVGVELAGALLATVAWAFGVYATQ